ncbi:hypothetical protein UMZ34_25850 [Halopseudomonas pachastrellae]|nr:hypothetical protein UMZ34_25850 [Halopseudomonas pachastrellae]
MLIFGFNPLSTWGWQHYLGRDWFGEAGFVSPARLEDWLSCWGLRWRNAGWVLSSAACIADLVAAPGFPGILWTARRAAWRRILLLLARRQMLGATPQRERGRVFPALVMPPLAAGSRRAHKRNG